MVPGKSPAPLRRHAEVEDKFDHLEEISFMGVAEIRNATKQSVTSDFRLRLMVIGVAAWAAFQTIRLVGLPLAQDALAGRAAPPLLYPAIPGLGVGALAPNLGF